MALRTASDTKGEFAVRSAARRVLFATGAGGVLCRTAFWVAVWVFFICGVAVDFLRSAAPVMLSSVSGKRF